MSRVSKVVTLALTGLITLLLFSLFAIYDYFYSYEQTKRPIAYERQYYLEFYIQAENRSALDGGLDVEPGEPFVVYACCMNLLGSEKDLTLAFGLAGSGQAEEDIAGLSSDLELRPDVNYTYGFSIDEGQYRELGLSLVPGPESAVLRVAVLDGRSVLAARECVLR